MSDFRRRFRDLEAKVYKHWDRADPDHLAGAAARALSEDIDLSDFDSGACLAWAVGSGADELPAQTWQFDFGQPAITVARNDDFRIDLLYWLENASATHDHITCGAFAAVLGDRLHGVYEFEGGADLDAHVQAGDLRRTEMGAMREGDVCTIRPEFIHDVFWLGQPSVTLVVRCGTHDGRPENPREYLAPGLSMVAKSNLDSSRVMRQTEGLELLRRANGQLYVDSVASALRSSDSVLAYYAFLDAALTAPDVLDSVLSGLSGANPAVEHLVAGRSNLLRRSFYAGVYSVDLSARLAAGLLWADADSDAAASIIRMLHPDQEPADVVRRGIEALDSLDREAGRAARELAVRVEQAGVTVG